MESQAGNEDRAVAKFGFANDGGALRGAPRVHRPPSDGHGSHLAVENLQRPFGPFASELAAKRRTAWDRDHPRGLLEAEDRCLCTGLLIEQADAHHRSGPLCSIGAAPDGDPFRAAPEPVCHHRVLAIRGVLEDEPNAGPPVATAATPTQFGSCTKGAPVHALDPKPLANTYTTARVDDRKNYGASTVDQDVNRRNVRPGLGGSRALCPEWHRSAATPRPDAPTFDPRAMRPQGGMPELQHLETEPVFVSAGEADAGAAAPVVTVALTQEALRAPGSRAVPICGTSYARSMKLQIYRWLASHRDTRWVQTLHRAAGALERAYENDSTNMETNGEDHVLHRVAPLGLECVFDVGANRGEWTAVALDVGAGQVHAFEIEPHTRSELAARFGADHRVTVAEAGLAFSAGTVAVGIGVRDSSLTSTVIDPLHPPLRSSSARSSPVTSTSRSLASRQSTS